MKKRFNIPAHIYLLAACMMLLWTSCKTERFAPMDESVKNVAGSWKVIKATRNGTDLTPLADFTQFRVKFDESGNYNLISKLPFVINTDGKFSFDDPQYPFKITFSPLTGQAVNSAFNFPIVGGVRQLNLMFSPGCSLNTYTYTLIKE